MVKSQRTVKILDMKIDSSNKTGQIDNSSLMRDTIRKNLLDIFKIQADLLLGTLIQITSKTPKNRSAPVAIIANTKDTKIAIEKILRESACKVVFEWPSSIYTHIKSIRLGYEQSPNFANKQILIRPAANNRSLTVSTCTNSSEKWTFTEHLNFPTNPTNLHKLGQKTQPCKSSLPGVIF